MIAIHDGEAGGPRTCDVSSHAALLWRSVPRIGGCMSDQQLALVVTVVAPGLDEEDLAALGLRMADELRADGAEVAPVPAGEAPPGAKGGELLALGSVALAIAPSVLPNAVSVLGGWLNRQPRSVDRLVIKTAAVEIDIPRDMAPEQLREYLDALAPGGTETGG